MKAITICLLTAVILSACCTGSHRKPRLTITDKNKLRRDSAEYQTAAKGMTELLKKSLTALDSLPAVQKKHVAILLLIASDVGGLTNGDHFKSTYKKDVAAELNAYLHLDHFIKEVDYRNTCLQSEIAYQYGLLNEKTDSCLTCLTSKELVFCSSDVLLHKLEMANLLFNETQVKEMKLK